MNHRLSDSGSAADRIRVQLDRVAQLRARAHQNGLATAVHEVKQLQARRFRATYADFLADARYGPAATFFLNELYGEHDFSERDAQFARIASAIERMFPDAVAELAVDLAETHALTETLDHELSLHWMELGHHCTYAERYVRSWRLTGARAARQRQLSVVLHMGQELQRLTQMKSLHMALRLMRGPAHAAGLSALQRLLESGFAAFGHMGEARSFLAVIGERERRWMDALFDDDPQSCEAALLEELRRV